MARARRSQNGAVGERRNAPASRSARLTVAPSVLDVPQRLAAASRVTGEENVIPRAGDRARRARTCVHGGLCESVFPPRGEPGRDLVVLAPLLCLGEGAIARVVPYASALAIDRPQVDPLHGAPQRAHELLGSVRNDVLAILRDHRAQEERSGLSLDAARRPEVAHQRDREHHFLRVGLHLCAPPGAEVAACEVKERFLGEIWLGLEPDGRAGARC